MRTVSLGDTGDDVRLLQINLIKLGRLDLVADGVFGPLTDGAVRQFQMSTGLVADGLVGPKTMAALTANHVGKADGLTPCSVDEAIHRALSMVGQGMYVYGTGDYRPGKADLPWTTRSGRTGSDCAGLAICYAYRLVRHRPGFNEGSWATIADDINCNSAIEDASHKRELFERIDRPELGCLLTYPTYIAHGKQFIGHVVIVVGTSRCIEWDAADPAYHLLDVVNCYGPTGRKPGVMRTDGSGFDRHDDVWPKPEHRTVMLRVRR